MANPAPLITSQPPDASVPAAVHSPPHDRPTHETIKDTLESIVIAFVLAFVFRAYVVEAFVIPTGSMAPTLLGEHLEITCQECGYRFKLDPAESDKTAEVRGEGGRTRVLTPQLTRAMPAICPMCHYVNHAPKGEGSSSGDRILVHKYIYSVLEPRRWDVVVFKNPYEPKTNFIKRLVGLPGEDVLIVEGNIYTKASGEPESAWRIARKGERPKVQLAVWQPVAISTYLPLDGGRDADGVRWEPPWVADDPAAWAIEGERSYRFSPPGGTVGTPGVIHFDFDRALANGPGWFAYNQRKAPPLRNDPVEDVRVAAAFQADQAGLAVKLQTTARVLEDDPSAGVISAEITADGRATLQVPDPHNPDGAPLTATGQAGPFPAGIARRVELWYVDQQASLWVDGIRLLHLEVELSMDWLRKRSPLQSNPRIAISVSGAPVTVHRVEVDRDLVYVSGWYPGPGDRMGQVGAGVLNKSSSPYRERVMRLNPDEFFCLGDNSPMSHDGRFWNTINPWINERMLKDADNQPRYGVVPRKLMMGRAFFVYYPAPFPLPGSLVKVIPNFGDMRFIH